MTLQSENVFDSLDYQLPIRAMRTDLVYTVTYAFQRSYQPRDAIQGPASSHGNQASDHWLYSFPRGLH